MASSRPPNARCIGATLCGSAGNARDASLKLGQFARRCEPNIIVRMKSIVSETLSSVWGRLNTVCHNPFIDIHVTICQLCGVGSLKVPGQGGQCGTGGQSDGYVMLNWPG